MSAVRYTFRRTDSVLRWIFLVSLTCFVNRSSGLNLGFKGVTTLLDEVEVRESCSIARHNKTCCYGNEFRCVSGQCIPLDKLCDSNLQTDKNVQQAVDLRIDCNDGSDEIGCSMLSCDFRSCPQTCLDVTANKSLCTCFQGYEKKVTLTEEHCEDIDECALAVHSCSHLCNNINGSFTCSCYNGYQKDFNGGCLSDDGNFSVIFQSGDEIWIHHSRNITTTFVAPSKNLDYLDFDPLNNMVYWIGDSKLWRKQLSQDDDMGAMQLIEGKNEYYNVLTDSHSLRTLDWANGNIYLFSTNVFQSEKVELYVSTSDMRYPILLKVLTIHGKLTSSVYEPFTGLLYFTVSGNKSMIGVVSDDGNNFAKLLLLEGQEPTALALDHTASGRMYWVDNHTCSIYYGYVDGKGLSFVTRTTHSRCPVSMDIFENHIYWVTRSSGEILRINKFFGSVEVILSGLESPKALKVYTRQDARFLSRSSCSKSCSYICLGPFEISYCRCPRIGEAVVFMGEHICAFSLKENPLEYPSHCNCRKASCGGIRDENETTCYCFDRSCYFADFQVGGDSRMVKYLLPGMLLLALILILLFCAFFYLRQCLKTSCNCCNAQSDHSS